VGCGNVALRGVTAWSVDRRKREVEKSQIMGEDRGREHREVLGDGHAKQEPSTSYSHSFFGRTRKGEIPKRHGRQKDKGLNTTHGRKGERGAEQ